MLYLYLFIYIFSAIIIAFCFAEQFKEPTWIRLIICTLPICNTGFAIYLMYSTHKDFFKELWEKIKK